jgi:hypothetical protein
LKIAQKAHLWCHQEKRKKNNFSLIKSCAKKISNKNDVKNLTANDKKKNVNKKKIIFLIREIKSGNFLCCDVLYNEK